MVIFLVLAFPLITGLGYGCAFVIFNARGAQPRRFERIAPLLYPLFLLIPLAGVLIAGPASLSWERMGMGIRSPRIGALSPLPALLLAAAVGAATGLALFLGERTIQRHAARRGDLPANRPRMEGGGLAPLFLLATVVVALIEEIVWRGYLIQAPVARWHWAPWLALLVSAVSFGSTHYFFGLRDVILKSFSGLVWGALFLATGSLLAPVLSHLVFDLLVWTPFNEL